MKRTLLTIAALILSGPVVAQQPPIQWQPLFQWFYDSGQVRLWKPNAVYMMAKVAGAGEGPQIPRQWNPVDLTQAPWHVSGSAKVASLVCDLIITGAPINNSTNTASADQPGSDGWFPHIHLTFRSHGDMTADPTAYVGDVESALRGDGVRTNFSVLVPLNQGRFDWLADFDDTSPDWDGTNTGGPAYGINCTLQAWAQ